jgi:hypothetical protein
MVLSWFSGACTADIGDEADTGYAEGIDTEPVASVSQALTAAELDLVDENDNMTLCSGDTPFLIGSGAVANGFAALYPLAGFAGLDPYGTRAVAASGSSIRTQAVCTNATTYSVHADDDDGEVAAYCTSDRIAVGGGGMCYDEGAKLYRSRPTPDTDGSEPLGWKASCTSGPVTAYALCVERDVNYDFRDCRTRRYDATQGYAPVYCDAGSVAVSGGAYCGGSGNYIKESRLYYNLTSVSNKCSKSTIHGYAVCCDGPTL